MLRYIVRRVLYMVPTVTGVILITFILFNVAGGDPALMRLGKQAKPEAMEMYDIQRGLDKPLVFGLWGSTRASESTSFDVNAGSWAKLEGVEYSGKGSVFLRNKGVYTAPAYFDLEPDCCYRWTVKCRVMENGSADVVIKNGGEVLFSEDVPGGRAFSSAHLCRHAE